MWQFNSLECASFSPPEEVNVLALSHWRCPLRKNIVTALCKQTASAAALLRLQTLRINLDGSDMNCAGVGYFSTFFLFFIFGALLTRMNQQAGPPARANIPSNISKFGLTASLSSQWVCCHLDLLLSILSLSPPPPLSFWCLYIVKGVKLYLWQATISSSLLLAGFDARSWLALSFLYGQLSLPASHIVLSKKKRVLSYPSFL